MRVDEMSGVAAVARGGVTVVEHVGGLADRNLGVACTPRTRFQIASVSKQFAAFAVLLLAAESRLSLDDPVGRWLDGCPQAWQAMRIRQLLTHTAGLGHWPDFPALDLYRPITRAHELDIFQREPLLSAPGARYCYSSPGYVLLALIVEQASGQPYARFLANAVFGPLGLRQTSAGDPPGGQGMAAGYRSGQLVPSVELATVGLGAGDVWSTAADLLRWDAAVARRELLPAVLHEAMFTACRASGSAGTRGNWSFTGYGYGWRIGAIGGRFRTSSSPSSSSPTTRRPTLPIR